MDGVSKWGALAGYDWSVMAPEFTILGVATLLSLLDLMMGKQADRRILAWLGIFGVVLSAYFVVQNTGHDVVSIMNDMYRLDAYGNAFKIIFLAGVGFVFLMSLGYVNNQNVPYPGEFYYLILTALLGTMIMASSSDLITLFVGLELLSISSYILAGTSKYHMKSNEAAFKYVISGGIATAITLYGMSFIYGMTGSTNLYEIADRLGQAYQSGFQQLIFLSFVLMIVGLAFKISAAPYHMWAPDVYEGAPTPITAFLSVVSKAAGFALILRVFILAFSNIFDMDAVTQQPVPILLTKFATVIAIMAAVSMIIGNTLAMRQTNVKRILAYSGIAQAGYLLVPFATFTMMMFEQTIFYLFAYLLANMGIFAIIVAVSRDRNTEELSAFAGLYHRAPCLAVAMTFFILSLAGLPITAGFFGKFYILMSAIWHSNYWLAGIMIATSVISYYYYFGFIRQMYMRSGETEARIRIPFGVGVVVLITFIGTIAAGIFPGDVMSYIHHNYPFLQIIQR